MGSTEMAEVEKLFEEFVAEHRAAGRADPLEFLRKVDGTERRELAVLIDAYLVRSPGRQWNAEEFAGSPAERWAQQMTQSLVGEAGLWPEVLPRLRNEAKITRKSLVERLAAAIGATAQTPKVASYYHQMEQGELPAGGVSTRVLEALAGIVGSSAEALRAAGEGMTRGVVAEEAVFARTAIPDPEYADADAAPVMAESLQERLDDGPDEVDRLFTGGD